MGIREDTFAHRSGEEGEMRAVDQVSYGDFRLGVGGAFANDNEGSFCGFEHLRYLEKFGLFGRAFWALWYWVYILHFGCVSNHTLDDICGQIDEARARPAVP